MRHTIAKVSAACPLADGFTTSHGRRDAGASAEVYGHARLARPPARHARDQRRHARPHHAHAAQHGRASGPQIFWCGLQPNTDDAPACCVIGLEPLLRGPWPRMDSDSDDSQYYHVASKFKMLMFL